MKKSTRYPGVRYHGDVLYYRVKLAGGKWTEVRFGKGRPKEAFLAKEVRQSLEDSIRAGRVDPRQRDIENHAARPIGELLGEYGQHLKDKGDSQGHVRNTKAFIQQCTDACGVKRILDFDLHRINRWLSNLCLSARSKNYRRTALLGFSRWAADFGRAPRNPLPSSLVPKYDENADRCRLSRAMSQSEGQQLFEALVDAEKVLGHRHAGGGHMAKARERRAFYLLAATTGLRWREVARLRWGDIDLGTRLVIVPAGQTKNGLQAELPLIASVVNALREIRPRNVRNSDRVFSAQPTLRTWKRDLYRAGIIGEPPPYEGYVDERGRRLDRKCLRMSFCTWLKQAGVDLRDAQRLMRHSDPRLTANIYTDLRVADLRTQVEKLQAPVDTPAAKHPKTA